MKEEQAQRWEIREARPKIVMSFQTQRRAHLAKSQVQAATFYPKYSASRADTTCSQITFPGDSEPSLLLSF